MQLHRYSFQYTIDALCKAGAWLAALCLLVLALVVSYEVVVRYTTGVSSSWIQEFSVYLMMAVGFLAAAYALQMNSHFAITFLSINCHRPSAADSPLPPMRWVCVIH